MIGPEEKGCFEWFKDRTVEKLPGSFDSKFWDTLLFQAIVDEPSVLYAVLALSSIHRRKILWRNGPTRSGDVPDEHERFMLRQYGKAIHHLQPHFASRSRASFRVALIACLVFTSLEFLRGRFETAQTHLQNGLRVLREMDVYSSTDDNGIYVLKPSCDSVDDWVVGAFSRLYLAVELFSQRLHSCIILQITEAEPPAMIFRSTNQAWGRMDNLLFKVLHLTKDARRGTSKFLSVGFRSQLLGRQRKIREELASWISTYRTSKIHAQSQKLVREEFIYQMISMYHAMAEIMLETCLCSDDESIYDLHTDKFVSIIARSVDNRRIRPSTSQFRALPGVDMSRSIIDFGWIPPLYYTALKCRIHRVRLQAIRLLESASHREGIWDSKIVARIARKVMEVEERDFYKDFNIADDFALCSHPEERDLLLPILPELYRLYDVKIILFDEPMDKVLLSCRQKRSNGDWEILSREYHIQSHCWMDAVIEKENM